MQIIADLKDVDSLANGLNMLLEWDVDIDPIDYQCGSLVNGAFTPFKRAPWCGDDSDGRSAFFDAAARHRSLHPAIKQYLDFSSGFRYDESGAGIFAALALVAHFPEEVDRAINHIAGMDLDHQILEGFHIETLVKHLGYNETTVRLIAARATVCCGQHGFEDRDQYFETLDLRSDQKLRKAFTDAVAAFELRGLDISYGEEFCRNALEQSLEDDWQNDVFLELTGVPEIGDEIAARVWDLFDRIEFQESEDDDQAKLAVAVHDWRVARGEFAGETATDQLLDAVGSSCADTGRLFRGNPTKEQLKDLLDAGADLNGRDSGGRTPLWLAARNALLTAVGFLIEHGADVHAECEDETALHRAVRYNEPEAAFLLAEAGASVDEAVWKSALERLTEEEQERLAQIAVQAGTACESAQALAGIIDGSLSDTERQELKEKAKDDLDANLLLTKAEAAAGDEAETVSRLLPLFAEAETWKQRGYPKLLSFLFDALRKVGRAEEAMKLWQTSGALLNEAWLPPRLLPALLECFAAEGRLADGLDAISSYSYKVEMTWCDKTNCLYKTIARLAATAEDRTEFELAQSAARSLADNHQTRSDTLEAEPELALEQLASLHFRPGAIKFHIEASRITKIEHALREFPEISSEDLQLPDFEQSAAMIADALADACTGFAEQVPEAGPIYLVIEAQGASDSMLKWSKKKRILAIGLARSANIMQARFEPIELRRHATIAAYGLEPLCNLPLHPKDMMAEFAASSAVEAPVVVLLHKAVTQLADRGFFRELWPDRPVVVVSDEPMRDVLHVGLP